MIIEFKDYTSPWHALAARAADGATAKGFDLPTWDNVPAKLAFVVTEIVEATEAETPEALIEELADIAIRLLGMIHVLTDGDWCERMSTVRQPSGVVVFQPLQLHLWPILVRIRDALERWRKGDKRDCLICIELAILETERCAARLQIGLLSPIVRKLEKNEAREWRHGKAESVG